MTSNSQIHDCLIYCLGTGTSMKSGGAKLVLLVQTFHLSEMMRSRKCFPHVSKWVHRSWQDTFTWLSVWSWSLLCAMYYCSGSIWRKTEPGICSGTTPRVINEGSWKFTIKTSKGVGNERQCCIGFKSVKKKTSVTQSLSKAYEEKIGRNRHDGRL
jgi:hypothetical protein